VPLLPLAPGRGRTEGEGGAADAPLRPRAADWLRPGPVRESTPPVRRAWRDVDGSDGADGDA